MALELVYETEAEVPEAVKSLYVAHEGKFKLEVNGIEDTKGLKSALEKERLANKEAKALVDAEKAAAKAAKEALDKYEGKDPEEIKKALDYFNKSEDAKLTEDERFNKRVAKHEEAVAKKLADQEADVARKLSEKDAELNESRSFVEKHKTLMLHGGIRAAAPADMHPSALEDAIRHAESLFEVNQNGEVVPKDGKYGKDGKTLYSPKEWFEESRATHPHRFIHASSGSAAAGKSAQASKPDLSHLSPTDRLEALREQGKK